MYASVKRTQSKQIVHIRVHVPRAQNRHRRLAVAVTTAQQPSTDHEMLRKRQEKQTKREAYTARIDRKHTHITFFLSSFVLLSFHFARFVLVLDFNAIAK